MADLSMAELIAISEEKKVNLGPDPEKTIRSCVKLGLIPKPKRKKVNNKKGRSTTLFFPEYTVDKLAYIKALKSEGLTLDEIRENFAHEFVRDAINGLLKDADEDKLKHLANIIGSDNKQLEAIVEAPLVNVMEVMSAEEVKRILCLFFGVGFYSLLEAQKALEEFRINDARKAVSKSTFYNSVGVLRLARTAGDTKLEKTASEVYDSVVIKPIEKATEMIRMQFLDSLSSYLETKKQNDI
ncbi:MAG: MerR family transcriptional regulator [Candidatus Dadabacteria bacterium]|nr:MerR family transcriptional regulator [Candidatus Dadabacteria bacterium]NIT12952.1 MerR family transcriptional regulator [Candidatus Dadabacteria bacterium]